MYFLDKWSFFKFSLTHICQIYFLYSQRCRYFSFEWNKRAVQYYQRSKCSCTQNQVSYACIFQLRLGQKLCKRVKSPLERGKLVSQHFSNAFFHLFTTKIVFLWSIYYFLIYESWRWDEISSHKTQITNFHFYHNLNCQNTWMGYFCSLRHL